MHVFIWKKSNWHEVYEYFGRKNFWSREALENIIEEASEKKAVDIAGYLMEGKKKEICRKGEKI